MNPATKKALIAEYQKDYPDRPILDIYRTFGYDYIYFVNGDKETVETGQ